MGLNGDGMMGKLIIFEGGDGCGKSTQVRLAVAKGAKTRRSLLVGELIPAPEIICLVRR